MVPGDSIEFATAGPFELLQARQLIESNIAEFAATRDQTRYRAADGDPEHARKEDRFRDSQWDLKFHVQVALATQNTAMATIVEKCGCSGSTTLTGKTARAYRRTFDRQLVRRSRSDPQGADAQRSLRRQTGDVAAPENTKQMLFNATSDDFEYNADRYLFAENPVVHLDGMSHEPK